MPAIARLGDAGSHGGQIITGSPSRKDEGKPIARIGDTYGCPIHGPNPIVTASAIVHCDNRRVARIGDSTACGATIVTGSTITFAGA